MQAIEAYLQLHPLAADTERGIAERWLVEMGADVPMTELQEAIDALVHRGVLAETPLPGGGSIYRAGTAARRRPSH